MSVHSHKIRVLIVDDSASIRLALGQMLSADPEIEVVGFAIDPLDAREKIKQLKPDVLTLDIEMPHMNGIEFLSRLMRLHPMPVVMVSSLTQRNAQATLECLELGAIEVVEKPHQSDGFALKILADELREKVKMAARTKVRGGNRSPAPTAPISSTAQRLSYHGKGRAPLIAIGASTGGVEALREILMPLPANTPPIVITQHMPPMFTASFAKRLDSLCVMSVVEAKHRQMIQSGYVYLAPGGKHLSVCERNGEWHCYLDDTPPVSGHRPSVDVLFHSVAKAAGAHAVGLILTGMGRDGAQGLLAMQHAGALTLGQNEATALVYGMPKAAYEIGAVGQQIDLASASSALLVACQQRTQS